MKALIDLHTHTLVSGHAYSTIKENVEAAISSVLVEKKAKEGTYKVGNTVTYEIKVINNGNVTVSGIKVIDELTGDKWTIDNLKPG